MKSILNKKNAIRRLVRELGSQLGQLNHRVGSKVALGDVDLACLDILARSGPLSPSALARKAQLHPATITGVLNRLEAGGWVVRERSPDDRRAVRVRALGDRSGELVGLYSGMNQAIDRICASFDGAGLVVIADFLTQIVAAGQTANDEFTDDDSQNRK